MLEEKGCDFGNIKSDVIIIASISVVVYIENVEDESKEIKELIKLRRELGLMKIE